MPRLMGDGAGNATGCPVVPERAGTMDDKKSYPDEIFAWRKKRYSVSKRTKLPNQEALETCLRINGEALGNSSHPLNFENDLSPSPGNDSHGDGLPADLFNEKMEKSPITGCTTLHGSGGAMTLPRNACMVDIAKYFVEAAHNDSCGECTFCRVGSKRVLEILERIGAGAGARSDLEVLEDLASKIAESSLCQVGKSAAHPVTTTLRLHRDQYLQHIEEHTCLSGKCALATTSKR